MGMACNGMYMYMYMYMYMHVHVHMGMAMQRRRLLQSTEITSRSPRDHLEITAA